MVTFGDGDVEPAFGLMGGGPGGLNKIELVAPDGKTRRLTSKDLVRGVPRGTLYVQHASGGGGYGNPGRRPVQKVRAEVRDGVISRDAAIRDYGRDPDEIGEGEPVEGEPVEPPGDE